MISNKQSKNWQIGDQKTALLASLPPLLFGMSVTVTWLIIGGVWYNASEVQLKLGMVSGLLVAGMIACGGVIALLKRMPAWSYTWLGVNILGFVLFLQGIAEELPYTFPQWAEIFIAVLLLAFCGFVLIKAVLESWQAAGLVGIGMSTAMGLANVHLMAIPPYNRADLAFLGLGCGLIFSLLIYIYTRSSASLQAGLLALIAVINAAILYLADRVWAEKMIAVGKASPLVPMLVLLLLLSLSGPLTGLLRKPIQFIVGKIFNK